jgi:hypothetical protein
MSQTVRAPETLRSFRESLYGALISPDDEDYSSARAVWNGLIDRQPVLRVTEDFDQMESTTFQPMLQSFTFA